MLMASGFTLISSNTWEVSESDPTLWVKLCSSIKSNTWTSNNLNNASDELGSLSTVTSTQLLTSITNNYNNITNAWIRLAAYPDDPSNPGSPASGDSTFTTLKASRRTIEVCYADPGSIFTGGYAEPSYDGKVIKGCKIVLLEKYKNDLKAFTSTLTHEIGHCLGLDHPMETTNAIMSYFHPDDKFRLMADDIMGLVFLYPKSGVSIKEKSTLGLSCSKN